MIENEKPAKEPTLFPVEFLTQEGLAATAWVKTDPRQIAKGAKLETTAEYHPTGVAVACTTCKTTGTLDFPSGFTFEMGDRIMNGKHIKARCLRCRSIREMRPFTPEELQDNRFYLIRRYYELFKLLLQQGHNPPPHVVTFLDAYERKMGKFEPMRPLAKPGEGAVPGVTAEPGPEQPPESPRIIIPA